MIAKNILMELNEFNRYNPNFDKVMAGASNAYDMMLPVDKMDMFNTVKYKILSESIELLLNNVSFTKEGAAPASSGTAPEDR